MERRKEAGLQSVGFGAVPEESAACGCTAELHSAFQRFVDMFLPPRSRCSRKPETAACKPYPHCSFNDWHTGCRERHPSSRFAAAPEKHFGVEPLHPRAAPDIGRFEPSAVFCPHGSNAFGLRQTDTLLGHGDFICRTVLYRGYSCGGALRGPQEQARDSKVR